MVPSGGRTWLTITFILCHVPFLFVQASLHKSIARHNGIRKRDPLSDSELESASWIWTSGPTTGNVAFLKTFTSATGKTAATATISMTAVNKFTVWVNGQPIGASGDGANDWQSAQVLSAALNSSTNTFSVLAVNNANSGSPAPGLLAAIQVKYSDGSIDTVVSDSSWAVSAAIPSDFPTPSDTSNFASATVSAPFGSGPWGKSVTVASAANAPSLSGSAWIWSSSTAASDAPVGTVGFRKTVATPSGKSAQSATILLTVDNGFTLYVNGDYVGAPPGAPQTPNFRQAQQFTVGLNGGSNIFTIFGSNIPDAGSTDAGPAGIIAVISIQYSDGSSSLVPTDTSWLSGAFTSASAFLSTADSALSPTFNIGALGASPWGQLSGISNVLAASNVPSGPFASGTLPQTPASGSTNSGGTNSAASSPPASAEHVSATGGASGSSTAPLSASTARLGNSSAPSGTEIAIIPSSSSSSSPAVNSGPDNAAGAAAAPSTHTVPIALIIGPVVGAIALIAIALVAFCWRRGLGSRDSDSQALHRNLLIDGDDHSQLGNSSMASGSRRTSVASIRRAETAWLQPQRATTYSFPQPPVMAQAAYPQPPVMVQTAYPQPPVMVQTAYPQPPLAVHTSDTQPSQTESSSGMVPPTKLERENMIWRNNATATSSVASSPHTSVAASFVPPSVASLSDAQAHSRAGFMADMRGQSRPTSEAYGGLDTEPDPDTETLAPPSYYAQ
ncbi:hypothetical protein C8R44DRAFT_857570 [Mycena epipterygia]|nr:hypothetical protein C8R44DRAFT_857570 [Mycena epipterygia]